MKLYLIIEPIISVRISERGSGYQTYVGTIHELAQKMLQVGQFVLPYNMCSSYNWSGTCYSTKGLTIHWHEMAAYIMMSQSTLTGDFNALTPVSGRLNQSSLTEYNARWSVMTGSEGYGAGIVWLKEAGSNCACTFSEDKKTVMGPTEIVNDVSCCDYNKFNAEKIGMTEEEFKNSEWFQTYCTSFCDINNADHYSVSKGPYSGPLGQNCCEVTEANYNYTSPGSQYYPAFSQTYQMDVNAFRNYMLGLIQSQHTEYYNKVCSPKNDNNSVCEYVVNTSCGDDCEEQNTGDIKDITDWKCIFQSIDASDPWDDHYILIKMNKYCNVYCREDITYDFPSYYVEVLAGRYFTVGGGNYNSTGPDWSAIQYFGQQNCRTGLPDPDKPTGIDVETWKVDFKELDDAAKRNYDAYGKWTALGASERAGKVSTHTCSVDSGKCTATDEVDENGNTIYDCPDMSYGTYQSYTFGDYTESYPNWDACLDQTPMDLEDPAPYYQAYVSNVKARDLLIQVIRQCTVWTETHSYSENDFSPELTLTYDDMHYGDTFDLEQFNSQHSYNVKCDPYCNLIEGIHAWGCSGGTCINEGREFIANTDVYMDSNRQYAYKLPDDVYPYILKPSNQSVHDLGNSGFSPLNFITLGFGNLPVSLASPTGKHVGGLVITTLTYGRDSRMNEFVFGQYANSPYVSAKCDTDYSCGYYVRDEIQCDPCQGTCGYPPPAYCESIPKNYYCQYVNGTYYGKYGNVVDKTTYERQCVAPPSDDYICKYVNNQYYGINGTVVDKATYESECSITPGNYYCRYVNGKYYGVGGNVVDEETFKKECPNSPEDPDRYYCIYINNQYYGINGTVVDKATYESECIASPPTQPGNKCDPTIEDCNLGLNVIWRPISLNSAQEAFPDEDGDGRRPGVNWSGSDVNDYIVNNRGVKGGEVYTKEPMYHIVMTPAIIQEIRAYNKQQATTGDRYGYGDFNLQCSSDGKQCESMFIRNSDFSKYITGCGTQSWDQCDRQDGITRRR